MGAGLEPSSFDLITCVLSSSSTWDEKAQRQLIDNFCSGSLVQKGRLSDPKSFNPQVTVNRYGHNPYHLREMSEGEFYELVHSRFRHVRMLNQLVRPSVAIFEGPGADAHQHADFYNSAQDSIGVPSNYIAICSHQLTELSPAFCYFDTSSDYIGEHFRTIGANLNKPVSWLRQIRLLTRNLAISRQRYQSIPRRQCGDSKAVRWNSDQRFAGIANYTRQPLLKLTTGENLFVGKKVGGQQSEDLSSARGN